MSPPIRVLELRSVRGTGGGPEKTILYGAQQTDRSRFAITVCYLRDVRDSIFGIDQRAGALDIDYVEIREKHSYDPAIWSQLRSLVGDRGIELVHSHEYKTNFLALALARKKRIVPLSTVHGWFGEGTFKESLYYAADRLVLTRFPRLIAVSSELQSRLVKGGCKQERITVIPNGIDEVRFQRDESRRSAVRARLGYTDKDVVIGAVGRLEHQKRFDLLMEAVATLRAKHPTLRLCIVGDGSLKDWLDSEKHRLSLAERCDLLGHQNDVIELHHAFDLFVQASEGEGSPNVVLEALALQTPVVATSVGGTGDLIDDGVHGLLVAAGDLPALISRIDEALGDWHATVKRAASARLRIEQQLSFGRRMNRVETIYEELIRR